MVVVIIEERETSAFLKSFVERLARKGAKAGPVEYRFLSGDAGANRVLVRDGVLAGLGDAS